MVNHHLPLFQLVMQLTWKQYQASIQELDDSHLTFVKGKGKPLGIVNSKLV